MAIKIDTDVPTPVGLSKYPFEIMKVGDSFHVDTKVGTLRAASYSFTRRKDGTVKFVVRAEDDGARCWRVA